MDSITGRKMKSVAEKASNAKASDNIAQSVKIIREKLPTKSADRLFFMAS